MSVALVMKAGKAARLVASGFPRFHALDIIGAPMCMSIMKPPIYPVDYDNLMDAVDVPSHLRCHRWGCIDAWVERQHDDGH